MAIFGGASRKGEWVVPEQLTAFAMFGGVELDLTQASFARAVSEIIAVAVMGGVEITVPEGLTVQVDGVGIFGGFDQKAEGPGEPGSPVLRIKGAALFGGVEVKRKPRKKGRGRTDRRSCPGPERSAQLRCQARTGQGASTISGPGRSPAGAPVGSSSGSRGSRRPAPG